MSIIHSFLKPSLCASFVLLVACGGSLRSTQNIGSSSHAPETSFTFSNLSSSIPAEWQSMPEMSREQVQGVEHAYRHRSIEACEVRMRVERVPFVGTANPSAEWLSQARSLFLSSVTRSSFPAEDAGDFERLMHAEVSSHAHLVRLRSDNARANFAGETTMSWVRRNLLLLPNVPGFRFIVGATNTETALYAPNLSVFESSMSSPDAFEALELDTPRRVLSAPCQAAIANFEEEFVRSIDFREALPQTHTVSIEGRDYALTFPADVVLSEDDGSLTGMGASISGRYPSEFLDEENPNSFFMVWDNTGFHRDNIRGRGCRSEDAFGHRVNVCPSSIGLGEIRLVPQYDFGFALANGDYLWLGVQGTDAERAAWLQIFQSAR